MCEFHIMPYPCRFSVFHSHDASVLRLLTSRPGQHFLCWPIPPQNLFTLLRFEEIYPSNMSPDTRAVDLSPGLTSADRIHRFLQQDIRRASNHDVRPFSPDFLFLLLLLPTNAKIEVRQRHHHKRPEASLSRPRRSRIRTDRASRTHQPPRRHARRVRRDHLRHLHQRRTNPRREGRILGVPVSYPIYIYIPRHVTC